MLLKRENISSFGNSYPTPAHPRPLSSPTWRAPFTATCFRTTFQRNTPRDTWATEPDAESARKRNPSHSFCACASPLRRPPPPPLLKLPPRPPWRPLIRRLWSCVSTPPVTGHPRCPPLSACAGCGRPSPWQRSQGALVSACPLLRRKGSAPCIFSGFMQGKGWEKGCFERLLWQHPSLF